MGLPAGESEWVVREAESVCTAVKRVVSDVEDCSPSKLRTLSKAIDSEELKKVVTSSEQALRSVSFWYCGHEVTIYSDRTILIAI